MKKILFLVLLIISCVIMISSCQSKKYSFVLENEEQVIDDNLAIMISRWALEQDGKPIDKMTPIKYWGDREYDEYFARNKTNSNYGQVYWHQKNKHTVWEYSVILEKCGRIVSCQIIAAK